MEFPPGQAFYYGDSRESIVIKGSDGKFKGMDMSSSLSFEMGYQTKGGTQDQIYGDGEWDTHEILNAIELGAVAVAIIGSGGSLAPLFFGVGAIAGIADAVVYFTEDDPYMGTMMLAINMLGIDDIVKLAKWGGSLIKNLSKQTIEEIGKKKLSKIALTAAEKQIYNDVAQFVYKNQSVLTKKMQQQMAYNFVTTGIYTSALKNKWNFKMFFNLIYKLNSIGLGIPGLVLKLGGVAITADQLYVLINGDDESRKKSSIAQILKYIYGSGDDQTKLEKLNKDALEAFKQLQENIKDDSSKYLNPDASLILFKMDPTQMVSEEQLDSYFKQLNQMREVKPTPSDETKMVYVQAPTIKDVIENNKVISIGMSGDSVSEINTLLKNKGYTDIKNLNLYDELTMWYISEMQYENKIPSNGSVDSLTYNILKGGSAVKDITKMEGCEKYEYLLNIGWIELNKIEFIKKKQSKTEKDEDLQLIDCNGQKFLLNRTKEKIESSHPKTMSGQMPVNKTIIDNPDNLNEEIQKIKDKINYL